jgi:hypothetical protein
MNKKFPDPFAKSEIGDEKPLKSPDQMTHYEND